MPEPGVSTAAAQPIGSARRFCLSSGRVALITGVARSGGRTGLRDAERTKAGARVVLLDRDAGAEAARFALAARHH